VPCALALRFVTQPENAVIREPITGSAFNPAGAPVTAEVVNRSRNLVHMSVRIKVTLTSNPGGATLGGTTVEQAVGGVATFKGLTLNQAANDYALTASTTAPITYATSNAFDEDDTATICQPSQPCTTSLSTSVSTFQVCAFIPGAQPCPATGSPGASADVERPSAESGTPDTLSESVDVGTPLTCPGYKRQDQNWFEFVAGSSDRSKIVTYTIENTSPDLVEACFGAPYEFDTSTINPETGKPEPAPPGTLPDGTPGFIGLLPSCQLLQRSSLSGPCVESISSNDDPNSTTGIDTILTAQIPAGLPGDPHMGG